jgi:N-acetylneuraminate synthase
MSTRVQIDKTKLQPSRNSAPAEVKIAGRKIGANHPPYIIAEMSGNHLRDIKRARMIFKEAKKAGVDAVKIQTYQPASLSIEIEASKIDGKPQWKEAWGWGTGDIFNLYKQVYTPQGKFTDQLFALGKEFGLTVFSTPFSVHDAELLATRYNPPAYKLGALEIDFFPMLEVIARTGKPIILNTAIATTEKVDATLAFLKKMKSGPVILLTGPKVYHEDAAKNFGLGRLHALQTRYGKTNVIGLSDHFRGGNYNSVNYLGHEFSTTGVLNYGAAVIEKHFCGIHSGLPGQFKNPDGTIDWSKSDIDGGASITTDEMTALVAYTQLAHRKRSGGKLSPQEETLLSVTANMAAYGYGTKSIGPSKAEVDTNEAGATRFVYATRDLKKGQTITLEDLHFSRAIHHANPSWSKKTPLPTSTTPQVLNKQLITSVEKGDPIFAESLSGKVDVKKPYEAGLFEVEVSNKKSNQILATV